jgi:CDP-diacylglycerol--glycerol-3-phosphate 3-phosphatidyltransferase
MHLLARQLMYAHVAVFCVSLLFMAVARPAVPERLQKYGFAMRELGRWMYWFAKPVSRVLNALHWSPNAVTYLGVVLTSVAAVFAGYGHVGLAGNMLVWGNICDVLDGELARAQGSTRKSGAFLDSNLDRVSEIVLFAGLGVGFPDRAGMYWAFAAAAASMLVSYARARGEGLGVSCPSGGLERPHRMLILMFTLLFGSLASEPNARLAAQIACAVIAVGAGTTAVARMISIYGTLRRAELPAGGERKARPPVSPLRAWFTKGE